MTLTWNPQSDFAETADALEAVTLTALSGSQTAVGAALRMRITEQEAAASGGRYTRRDVKWHLPASALASPPQIGATITDAQLRVWTILQVDHDTRSSRYRCWCRSAQIAATLIDRVHIQQVSWSKDAHGALTASWSNWRANLAARVQALSAESGVEHDQRVLTVTYRVYLGEPVDITVKHRVLHPASGDVLHIRGYESASQLDALFVLHCIKSPWQLA
jgi:hypothetical protein